MPLINFPPVTEKYVVRECDRELSVLLAKPENKIIEINGEAKMGKSCLTAQVLHSMSEKELKEKPVLWVNCTDINTVNESVLAIGNTLKFLDEKTTETPQKMLQAFKDYCTKTPGCIIVCDQVNPNTAKGVLDLFKSNQSDGRLVYTTANENFTYQARLEGLPDIKKVSVSGFTAEQAKTLVKLHLPTSKAVDESSDFSTVIQRTGGNPELLVTLCQVYEEHLEFDNFVFLCQGMPVLGNELVKKVQSDLNARTKKMLENLETEATQNETARQALSFLKQVAYLAPQSLPINYFVDTSRTDVTRTELFTPVNKLKELKLKGLSLERSGTIILSVQLLQTLRNVFASEKNTIIKANSTQLALKFVCYTTDDWKKQKTYAALAPYVPHVHRLLFDDTNDQESKMDHDEVMSRASLWCSLGRMYHSYLGVLPASQQCFKKGVQFVKKHLAPELITTYDKSPTVFMKPTTEPSVAEIKLLTFYAREFLAQQGNVTSRLSERAQLDPSVVPSLESAYFIQKNLFESIATATPDSAAIISIAYTLRTLTRAMRKQNLDIKKYSQELQAWIAKHKSSFNAYLEADLLSDIGTILKEAEDAKPLAKRNYAPAIQLLEKTRTLFEKDKNGTAPNPPLAKNSIYLGDAYLAAGSFEKGISELYRAIYFNDKAQWILSRVYFNLAQAYYQQKLYALAKACIHKALPLQSSLYPAAGDVKHPYVEKTEELQRKIEAAFQDQLTVGTLDATVQFQDTLLSPQEVTDACEAALINQAKQNQGCTLDEIQKQNSRLFQALKRSKKEEVLTQQKQALVLDKETIATEVKQQEDQRELSEQKQSLWYRQFETSINLDDTNNAVVQSFKVRFEEELFNKVIEKIRLLNGTDTREDTLETAGKLAVASSNILPKVDMAGGAITGSVDLPVVVQGIVNVLLNVHHQKTQTHAKNVLEIYQNNVTELYKAIKPTIAEMAGYVARCYQPQLKILEGQKKGRDIGSDIKLLAETGAQRVINYQQSGKISLTPSLRELVMVAIVEGDGDAKLGHTYERPATSHLSTIWKTKHWSARGFFAKPGLQVLTGIQDKPIAYYLPNAKQNKPEVYGYRYGSIEEARKHPVTFFSPAEAASSAEAVQTCKYPCVIS